MRLKNSKFDLLFEDNFSRFQTGGLAEQDIVKFRRNALNHPALRDAQENVRELVRNLMESDLILKVSSVKMIKPGVQYNSVPSSLGFLVDIVQEYAPGLWRTPLTVPIEVLEKIDTGADRQPVPDSLRRKEKINIEPEEASTYTQPRELSG